MNALLNLSPASLIYSGFDESGIEYDYQISAKSAANEVSMAIADCHKIAIEYVQVQNDGQVLAPSTLLSGLPTKVITIVLMSDFVFTSTFGEVLVRLRRRATLSERSSRWRSGSGCGRT
jgi:hypothetical protein